MWMRITVGITGASGSIYGYTLVRVLASYHIETSVIFTDMGEKVLEYECGIDRKEIGKYATVYENNDLFARLASGSYKSDGMVIIPCSMNTLGSIAGGLGDSLMARAAAVTLKEGRKLITVVRETPYSMIHLENMLKLARAGACIMPASPGFYHKPTAIWELVESLTTRVLDQFGIEQNDVKRWGDSI
jgi:4-hydroxy-3-polyprenylbenzoate decarboxylase